MVLTRSLPSLRRLSRRDIRCWLLRTREKAGTLPIVQKGLELSTRGVLVTAFGPNPGGPGTVLRLWECAGQGGPCEVRLPAALDVRQINLSTFAASRRGCRYP